LKNNIKENPEKQTNSILLCQATGKLRRMNKKVNYEAMLVLREDLLAIYVLIKNIIH